MPPPQLSASSGGGGGGNTAGWHSVQTYKYPRLPNGRRMRLRPGSGRMAKRICDEVNWRADQSHSVMQTRFDSWNYLDEVLTAYIRKDSQDDEVTALDDRKPTKIVIPITAATLDTLMTYMAEVFLGTNPMFAYEGVAPEDEMGAKLLEVVVDQQLRHTKAPLAVHTMLRDGLIYGMGIVAPTWTKETLRRRRATNIRRNSAGDVIGYDEVESIGTWEGNKYETIDPYRAMPDPNVSIHDVQEMEFFGWSTQQHRYALQRKEAEDEDYFNVDYLIERGGQMSTRWTTDNSRRQTARQHSSPLTFDTKYSTLVNMYIWLTPREWGLHNGKDPELWFFTVADEDIVLRAKPVGLLHGKIPIVVNSPDYDGYSVTPASRLEMVADLNHAMNWAMNSHIENVRRSLNNLFLVDPMRVNMFDLLNPLPGGVVRMSEEYWGMGTEGVLQQLNIHDVTQQHVQELPVYMDIIQKVSAATDATMGIVRSGGERRTATEYAETVSNAVSRLKHLALMSSLMAMQDLGYFSAMHSIDLLETPQFMRAVGSWPEVLKKEYEQQIKNKDGLRIDPESMWVDFNVIPKDGSTVADSGSRAQTWIGLLDVLTRIPPESDVHGRLDMHRIVLHIARLLGVKNLHEFEKMDIQVETAPDDEVREGVEKRQLAAVGGV